jgi:hypothetical protein
MSRRCNFSKIEYATAGRRSVAGLPSEPAGLGGTVLAPSRQTTADQIDRKWLPVPPSELDDQLRVVRQDLLAGRPAAAVDVLADRLRRSEEPAARILLGDALAAQGAWVEAGVEYQRAVALAPGDPVATLGLAHALTAVGRVEESLALLDGAVGSEVVGYYRALALLCRADEVRGVTRDGEPVITTRAQAVECGRIAAEILSATTDGPLVEAASRLREDAEAARSYAWRRRPTLWIAIAAVVALALAGVVVGGLRSSTALLVTGIVLGAVALGAGTVTGRQSGWQRRAELTGPLLARSGI